MFHPVLDAVTNGIINGSTSTATPLQGSDVAGIPMGLVLVGVVAVILLSRR